MARSALVKFAPQQHSTGIARTPVAWAGQINADEGMSTKHLIPADILAAYEVHEWRNAAGVMSTARPAEWDDLLFVLRTFRLYHDEVVAAGGNKSPISRRLDSLFTSRGWKETKFNTAIRIDDTEFPSPTHKVDCYKNKVALEVEWNNKDPFYDRDLNNFRLLFDLRAVEVGIIITRCSELQDLFNSLKAGAKKGKSTTHIGKLLPKVEGGGGGGCPVLVFGIGSALYDANEPPPLPVAVKDKIEDDEEEEGSEA